MILKCIKCGHKVELTFEEAQKRGFKCCICNNDMFIEDDISKECLNNLEIVDDFLGKDEEINET